MPFCIDLSEARLFIKVLSTLHMGIVSAEQTMWWYQAYYLAEAWSTTWPQQLKPFWWPMQA